MIRPLDWDEWIGENFTTIMIVISVIAILTIMVMDTNKKVEASIVDAALQTDTRNQLVEIETDTMITLYEYTTSSGRECVIVRNTGVSCTQ